MTFEISTRPRPKAVKNFLSNQRKKQINVMETVGPVIMSTISVKYNPPPPPPSLEGDSLKLKT